MVIIYHLIYGLKLTKGLTVMTKTDILISFLASFISRMTVQCGCLCCDGGGGGGWWQCQCVGVRPGPVPGVPALASSPTGLALLIPGPAQIFLQCVGMVMSLESAKEEDSSDILLDRTGSQ